MPEVKDGTRISTTPGYLVIEIDGQKTQYPISLALRAVDIPNLTYVQVGAIKTLANLIADLTKKLIAAEILDAEFTGEDGYDLEAIVQTISDIGGDFGEPSLEVT